ncbi:MAG: beta-lactamase family protein [Acidobacteriia bacterium]|nr:beta-lactamase family protein [Terriglobia bacterium]
MRFLATILAAGTCLAQAPLAEKIQSELQKSGAPSVSVAVVTDGKLTFAQGFGKADISSGRASDVSTRYAVGSISKQFTVAVLLLLEEEGRLSLDDKVSKYFPDLMRANEITIRQLVSHTAGYEDFAPQDYTIPEWLKPTTPRATLDRWAKKPLNFDPGTRWQYSNTNYVLAGAIAEKVSGKTLIAMLKERIFEPLQMKSAGDCLPILSGDAIAYTRFALGPPRPSQREADGWYFAAGELCMTPSDLARWDIAFLEKKILSAKSYEEFTRETLLANGDHTHYALGLSLREIDGLAEFSHGGEVSGFISSNAVFQTRKGAVVVLSNQDGMNLVQPLSDEIARMTFLPPSASAPKDTDVPRVTGVVEGLQKGKIDPALFTENARFYFTATALGDIKSSIAPLGKLKSVALARQGLRGGMTFRIYRAEFEHRTMNLSIYVTPDGKFEQFMVEAAN